MTAEPVDPLAHVRLHNPHAGQGSVMLDIGDGVGALVVTMPVSMIGEEVEIWSEDPALAHELGHEHGHGGAHDAGHGHPHRPHVAVLPRPVPGGGEVPSLVFPALLEGRYRLHDKGRDEVRMDAEVRSGHVTSLVWPGLQS